VCCSFFWSGFKEKTSHDATLAHSHASYKPSTSTVKSNDDWICHATISATAKGRDEAIAAQIIEEFDHGTHLILSWFGGCRWCWRDRPVDRQQILDDRTMLVRCQGEA
jgi:hypothetical protein